jgi:sarcosine oxidase
MAPMHDVAIVGAGLLGLAAAREVAAQGRDLVVLEQAEIGHPGSGSKGSCRIFRLGYPDPGYVRAALHARELWRELEDEAGRQLLTPAPQLTFGPQLGAVAEALQAAGAPGELLPMREVARRFGAMVIAGRALLESQSCVIAADQTLEALARAAGLAEHDGRLRTGVRVTRVADDGREVTLDTTQGALTARIVILTAGPWTAGLLGPAVTLPSEATLEQIAYLEPAGPLAEPAPIFIHYGDQFPYGLPVPGSDLYKIGLHHSGPTIVPDEHEQTPELSLMPSLREVARSYLPGYNRDPVATERCVYDNAPDEDFVVDRIGNIVIGCGTSGHGFKFGPLLGKWLAALALDGPGALADAGPAFSAQWPASRFSLARFTWDSAPAPG